MRTNEEAMQSLMEQGSRNLARFVITRADKVGKYIGMGYEAVEHDPLLVGTDLTTRVMSDEYRRCLKECRPFPVWAGANENTIYRSKEANWAFRFWHDMTHLAMGRGFTLRDEVEVGTAQTMRVAQEFGKESIEARMFFADTVGQSRFAATHGGEFPADQWEFAKGLLLNGLQVE